MCATPALVATQSSFLLSLYMALTAFDASPSDVSIRFTSFWFLSNTNSPFPKVPTQSFPSLSLVIPCIMWSGICRVMFSSLFTAPFLNVYNPSCVPIHRIPSSSKKQHTSASGSSGIAILVTSVVLGLHLSRPLQYIPSQSIPFVPVCIWDTCVNGIVLSFSEMTFLMSFPSNITISFSPPAHRCPSLSSASPHTCLPISCPSIILRKSSVWKSGFL